MYFYLDSLYSTYRSQLYTLLQRTQRGLLDTIFYLISSSSNNSNDSPILAQEEGQLIRLAIARVVSDLNGCVSFEEVYASAPQFKVKITPQKGET